MKTVLPRSASVFHAWANQTQSRGRNSKDTVSFDGPLLYSYRAVIARLVTRKGRTVVLSAYRKWSVTTTHHQSSAYRASSQYQHFGVADLGTSSGYCDVDHKKNLEDYRTRLKQSCENFLRARFKTHERLNAIQHLAREAQAYSDFFGLRAKFKLPQGFDAQGARELVESYEKKHRENLRKLEKRRQQSLAKARAEYDQKLAAWRDGEYRGPTLGRDPDGFDALRLRAKGMMIETTSGASVHVEAAKEILPFVRAGVLTPYPRMSDEQIMSIDRFAVRLVEEDGTLHVGCHKIRRSEIEAIAAQLGL